MGPNLSRDTRIRNMDRLIDILTKDGSLKKKLRSRKGSQLPKVILLSCRAGIGFHVVLAQRLYKALGMELRGRGSGFTFGSPHYFAGAFSIDGFLRIVSKAR